MSLKSDRLLPDNYQVKNAANFIYDYAFSSKRGDGLEESKKHKYQRYFVYFIFVTHFVKSLLCLLFSNYKNKYMFDLLYKISSNTTFYWHLFHISGIVNCLIFFIKIRNKSLPTNIFKVLSGLCRPKKIGFYHEKDIEKFVKR